MDDWIIWLRRSSLRHGCFENLAVPRICQILPKIPISVRVPGIRFLPGNPGGPGRPARCVEREYLEVTIGSVSPAQWRRIVKKAVADAEAGDSRAREWLSRWLLPAPAEKLEINKAGGEDIELLAMERMSVEELRVLASLDEHVEAVKAERRQAG